MPKHFTGGSHKVYLQCPQCRVELVKKKMKTHMLNAHGVHITEFVVRKEN